tara:strand:- start:1223 stop:1615 length:393 start_codon:yes stop_codon:yes gene_type:complete
MSDNNPEIQSKVNESFKKNVKKWLAIDDEIRAMRARSKELTNEKKDFEESILKHLEDVQEKEFLVPGGKLRKNVYKTKAPLTKESIQKALTDIIKDKTQATTMTDHIIKSRPIVERVNLKRTKNRSNDDN